MIQISMELASKLAGVSQDALKTALTKEGGEELKDDAAETFATMVTDKFKEVERDRSENSYRRGIKEKAESIEAALKPLFKKNGIEADKVEDAIAELSDKLKKVDSSAGGKPPKLEELTEEAIQKLPAYQLLLDKELAKVQAKAQEWESKYNAYTQQVAHEKVYHSARDRAFSILDAKKAVWGGDKGRQLDFFFKAIGTDNFELDEGGDILMKDKDGQPLRDEARNRVTFEQYILDNWQQAGYTFHEAEQGSGSAGAQRGNGTGNGRIAITSDEQYKRLLKEAGTDNKKRAEIMMAYAEIQRAQK